jgi:peptidyl-prolyl cis-trans isomerase C
MKALVMGAVVMAAVFFVSCSGKSGGEEGQASDGGKVVAEVGDETVTLAQVDRVVGYWRQSQQPPVDLSLPVTELRAKALDQLVDRLLLYQEARRRGYTADSAQVEQQVQRLVGQFHDPAQLEQALRSMGMDLEGLRKTLSQDQSIQNFIKAEIVRNVQVDSAQVTSFYLDHPEMFQIPERVRARHILFRVAEDAPPDTVEAVRRRAEEALARARGGEDFAQLASELSEGPTASRGGDLGYFQRGQMVAPFESTAFALEAGQISDLVRTRFGFHIIKVEDHIPARQLPLDRARPQIRQQLQQQAVQDSVEALLERLRSSVDIKKNL